MTVAAAPQSSRRVAVFGSVAAEQEMTADRDQTLSPPARAVLELVFESIASSAPAIARPILDRAVAEGAITRAERHAMLIELSDPAASEEDVVVAHRLEPGGGAHAARGAERDPPRGARHRAADPR